jgi:hypothetical protein
MSNETQERGNESAALRERGVGVNRKPPGSGIVCVLSVAGIDLMIN